LRRRRDRNKPRTRIVTRELLAASYWDRTPEEIHADKARPRDNSRFAALIMQEQAQYTARLQRVPEEDRDVFNVLHPSYEDAWLTGTAEERQHLVDVSIAHWLAERGPGEEHLFDLPGVRRHLHAIWQGMREGPKESRERARERWRMIFSAAEPSFRSVKDGAEPLAVMSAVVVAKSALKPIVLKRWRSYTALLLKLTETLKGWREADIQAAAHAIESGDMGALRRVMHAAVGLKFGVSGDRARILASAGRGVQRACRRAEQLRRRADAGRQRYEDWLKENGAAPQP
jgi:hypothetical protein